MFDIFLKPVLIAVTVALIAVGASHLVTSAQLRTARTNLTLEKAARATERADRAQVALADAAKVVTLQQTHASKQQEITDAFTKKLAARDAADRAGRLRNTVTAYTASGGDQTQSDPATCQRDRDKLAVVGNLLGEGAELVIEGRSIVEQRAAEIDVLQGIIANDRGLLQ